MEKDWRSEKRREAPLIRSKWPHVARLIFEFEYHDLQWPSHAPKPRTLELTPKDKAFFDQNCPYEGCFRGGYDCDIAGAVSAMIESGESERSGELVCHGRRMSSGGEFTCGLILRYTIKAEYKPKALGG